MLQAKIQRTTHILTIQLTKRFPTFQFPNLCFNLQGVRKKKKAYKREGREQLQNI